MGDAIASFLSRPLGSTGINVCGLGLAGGYGAPVEAVEMAFERGVNYFYHGSLRAKGMNQAIKNIAAKGKREKIIVVAQDYMRRSKTLVKWSFDSFLRKTELDYVDVLLLGWHNSEPDKATIETALEIKSKGQARFIAISGHNRPAFPEFATTGKYDILHLRYNAIHRGAETEIFPHMPQTKRPGVVVYTATSWGQLLRVPSSAGDGKSPTGSDCYRFVLSNPSVDVVITGPKNMAQMTESLKTLEKGPMSADELEWMRKVGEKLKR